MKFSRLFAALLLVSALAGFVSAQENSEFASLRAKAENGNSIAQYNLGLAYAGGHAVAADPLEAYVWLVLARENGARGLALDTLTASFDQATLAAAQQRLAERKKALPAVSSVESSTRTEATALAEQINVLTADKKQLSSEVAAAWKEIDGLKADLARATQSLAALEKAPKPTADTSALQAALATAQAQVGTLQAALAAKPAALNYPDLSGRVGELEAQLATFTTEANRAKQEIAALTKAVDEASKNRGPTYPNLAGRVVELETALADTKKELSSTQSALRTAELPKPAAVAPETPPSDLQKQLAETEDKLSTALRGYALLQREQDGQLANASKAAEAVTTERDALAAQVATLSAQVDQLKTSAQSQNGSSQSEITRLNEALAALQRSTSKNAADLAATRALLQQVQGANAVLANDNYQLKTRLAPGGAPAPAGVTSAPTLPTARTHVVATGDTLSRISQRYYGNPNRWQDIFNANREKLGKEGVLRVGSELRIP